jgi:hypothetical protein
MFAACTIGIALAWRASASLLRGRETRGARDQRHAMLRACGRVHQRAVGPREVDQHVGVRERRVDVVADRDAGRAAERSSRVLADRARAGDVERRGELEVGRIERALDERLAHAAAGAGDRDADPGTPSRRAR